MNKSRLLQFARLLKCVKEVNTDKGLLVSDGDINVGTDIFITDENGNLVPAIDGEYITEGMKITVESGIVKAIEEIAVNNEEPVEEPMAEEGAETPADAPKDEPVEQPTEPGDKDTEIAEKEAKIEELQKALDEANQKLADAENKIAELEEKLKEPVEEPVEPQYSKMQKNADKMTEHLKAVAAFKIGK